MDKQTRMSRRGLTQHQERWVFRQYVADFTSASSYFINGQPQGLFGFRQAVKVVNQAMTAGIFETVREALSISKKLNLSSKRLLSVVGYGYFSKLVL